MEGWMIAVLVIVGIIAIFLNVAALIGKRRMNRDGGAGRHYDSGSSSSTYTGPKNSGPAF